MMKKYLMAFCLAMFTLGTSSAFAQQAQATGSKIQWFTNYNTAVKEAAKNQKPIVLFFTGSDWCGWCKKMHQEVFSSPDFVSQVGNAFIFVDVDFPMNQQLAPEIAQQNNMLKQKFGVTGYPTVIILDSKENFIAETGYRPGGGKAYADYLKQLIQ